MLDANWITQRLIDLKIGAIFLTRIPLGHDQPIAKGDVSRALWSAPLIGAAVGALGAVVYGIAHSLHVPALPAAALAVVATLGVTGGLHEDGLADVADGFGGGATRERKLEIMRDSRIGTYGVCALVLSLILRVSALASIGEPTLVLLALVTASAAGRATMPAFMLLVPPARTDGMSADAGVPPHESALAAALIAIPFLVAMLGARPAIAALVLLAAVFGFMAWLCKQQIQGQTGDVLGALEQAGEITVLLVCAAVLS